MKTFPLASLAVTVTATDDPEFAGLGMPLTTSWVAPAAASVAIAQDRISEKTFLSGHGFGVAPFAVLQSVDDVRNAAAHLFPGIVKRARLGYDGKGQARLKAPHDIETTFADLNGEEAVLEPFVDFEKEVSVVCARDRGGNFAHYGVIENAHANHILDVSFAPAAVSKKVAVGAIEIARDIAEAFDYVGRNRLAVMMIRSHHHAIDLVRSEDMNIVPVRRGFLLLDRYQNKGLANWAVRD